MHGLGPAGLPGLEADIQQCGNRLRPTSSNTGSSGQIEGRLRLGLNPPRARRAWIALGSSVQANFTFQLQGFFGVAQVGGSDFWRLQFIERLETAAGLHALAQWVFGGGVGDCPLAFFAGHERHQLLGFLGGLDLSVFPSGLVTVSVTNPARPLQVSAFAGF